MPEDMDIYMRKIKQRADATDSVMEKITGDRMADLDKLRIEAAMEEVKAKVEKSRAEIREAQNAGKSLIPQQAYNFAELLFAGRPPEEIKQIIASLTEEEIQKLAYMSSTMNNSRFGDFREVLGRPSTTMKEVVDAIKIGTEIAKPQSQPQGSIGDIAKSLVEAVKIGLEAGKAQVQPAQQTHTDKYLDLLLEELKMARQEQAKDREARLEKEITELKNRPGAMDELTGSAEKYQKMQKVFGGSGGGKTAVDIEIEKMQQSERLDNRRISFEEKKFDTEQANEGKGLETIKEILTGPVGDVIKSLGSAGADRVRGSPPKGAGNMAQAQCPACKGTFMANPNLSKVSCPSCGAILEKLPAPPTPETATPEPQPQPEQPQPEQPSQPSQVEVTNIGDLNKR